MFEDIQSGGRGGDVGVHKVKQVRTNPGRHLHRKGNEQKNPSDQRRIEKVFADAAESGFGDDDCDKATDQGHPYRHIAGEVISQQNTGDNGRKVAGGRRLLKPPFGACIFKKHASGNGGHKRG